MDDLCLKIEKILKENGIKIIPWQEMIKANKSNNIKFGKIESCIFIETTVKTKGGITDGRTWDGQHTNE
jgi:hypothetical protein